MGRMSGYDEDEFNWSAKVEDNYYLLKDNFMNRLTLALTSKVFWTVVVMVAIAVVPQLKSVLSPTVFAVLEAALGVLASYFNVNPSPTFTAKLNRMNY